MRQYLPISFHPLFSRFPRFPVGHQNLIIAAVPMLCCCTHARTTRQQQQQQTKNIAAMKREVDDDDSGWPPPFHFLFALFLLGRHNVSLNLRDDFENVQQLVLLSVSPPSMYPLLVARRSSIVFSGGCGRFPRNRHAIW